MPAIVGAKVKTLMYEDRSNFKIICTDLCRLHLQYCTSLLNHILQSEDYTLSSCLIRIENWSKRGIQEIAI